MEVAIGTAAHVGLGQELLQSSTHANRTTAWTATAVGRAEGLVQIDVHHVKTHIAWTTNAEHRIEVGTIVIHQTAAVVNEAGYFRDARLEDTERVGIGHHHTGDVVTQHSAKGVNVDGSLGRALHLDNL